MSIRYCKIIWVIAAPKAHKGYDIKERNSSKKQDKGERIEVTQEEAQIIAREELKTYNQRLN